MEKSALLLNITQHFPPKTKQIKPHPAKGDGGFTIIELLVVVVVAGLIAAIAAPGWLGFVSQRRANKGIDGVLSALQDAQSKAKNQKLSYSVAFRQPNGVPQVAVYRTMQADGRTPVDPGSLPAQNWRTLGENLDLKPGQLRLVENLTRENNGNAPLSQYEVITFDYTGALPRGSNTPLIISVGLPEGTNNINESTKRCVKVTTLLGAMTLGKGTQNPASNPEGCP